MPMLNNVMAMDISSFFGMLNPYSMVIRINWGTCI